MKFSTTAQGIAVVFSGLLALSINVAKAQSANLWSAADAEKVYSSDRYSVPVSFRTVQLDISEMRDDLSSAPLEFTTAAKSKATVIPIPMPDGSLADVSVQETQVMSPRLAAHYPQIRTYTVKGISDPLAVGRIDMTIFGFHAMILSPKGDVFIDPVSNESDQLYISYYKKDLPRHDDFECEIKEDLANESLSSIHHQSGTVRRSSGDELRTYRLALACTGEYATKKGGTVSGALSGMVT